MELYTTDAKRPDLNRAALQYTEPEGYIGNKIMPVSPASQTTGVLYYATKTAIQPAQTNRQTATAPTETLVADSHLTFTCSEVIQRYGVAQEEVKHMRGIEEADVAGATGAVLSVADTIEGAVADTALKVDSEADYTFSAATIMHNIVAAKKALRGYWGRLTLFASEEAIQRIWMTLKADTNMGKLLYILVNNREGLDVNEWASALRVLFGIERVLIGDNGIWNEGERGDRFGLGRLYDGTDPLIYHSRPIFGIQKVYIPDPANPDWPYEVTSLPNKERLVNLYTAQSWVDRVVFNAGAVKVFTFGDYSDSASASGSASA